MESKISVTSDPIFVEAISIAKGIAKRDHVSVLMPALVLAGLVKALSTKSDNDSQLSEKLEAIKSAVSAAGLVLPEADLPIFDGKMPLSDDLKKAISANGESFLSLVDALLVCVSGAATLKNHSYNDILAYASVASALKSCSVITPELFSASAYIAFTQGRFSDNQALSNFLIGNRAALEALIETANLDRSLRPATNQTLLPLSEEILLAMKGEGTEGERLFAVLNVGVKSGQRLVSEASVAYHEAGHAVVSAILRPTLSVTKISIVRDGDSDGTTYYDASSSYWEQSQTRDTFVANLATLLAGRAAQLIKFGPAQVDMGASSDIERATEQAWRGISLFGLDLDIGPVNLEVLSKLQGQSGGWLFDRAQQRLHATLNEAANRAEAILRANWAQVEAVVSTLLKKKILSESDFADHFLERGVSDVTGVLKAKSRPVVRRVTFARSPGILETPEGPVRYDEGDAILTESTGHTWPAPRHYFDRSYQPEKGTSPGKDGAYIKAPQDVFALQLTEEKRLDLALGRGFLNGKAGDWLVEYASGELSIVSRDQFLELYEIVL